MTDRIEQLQRGLAAADPTRSCCGCPRTCCCHRLVGAGRRASAPCSCRARARRRCWCPRPRRPRRARSASPATSARSRPGAPTSPPPAAGIAGHLRTLAAEHGVTGGAIGYEGSFESSAPPTLDGEAGAVGAPTQALIREAFGTERLVDQTELLESTRAIKSERDIDRLPPHQRDRDDGPARPSARQVAARAYGGRDRRRRRESAILIGGHGHRGARVRARLRHGRLRARPGARRLVLLPLAAAAGRGRRDRDAGARHVRRRLLVGSTRAPSSPARASDTQRELLRHRPRGDPRGLRAPPARA